MALSRTHTRWLAGAVLVLTNACAPDRGPAPIEDGPATDDATTTVPTDARAVLLDPTHPAWAEPAPDTFLATVETTVGEFVIEVVRAWAPLGADRFYNLARHGYYDDARFHRVIPEFITQWGVAGDPEITAVWYDRGMPDDSVVASNVRGTIAFAFTDPGTRSTQVYINMVDNTRLDAQGFAPDTEGDPPCGELREAAEGSGSEGDSVVCTDTFREAELSEEMSETAHGDLKIEA